MDAYTQKVLSEELAKFQAVGEGGRNPALNTLAFKVGRVAGDNQTVFENIVQAGVSSGLPEGEARATARSGWQGGLKNPRERNSGPPPPHAKTPTAATVGVGSGKSPSLGGHALLPVLQKPSSQKPAPKAKGKFPNINFDALKPAKGDAAALAFFLKGYGLQPEQIPEGWLLCDYYGKPGVAYCATSSDGGEEFAWRSFARDAKDNKRATRALTDGVGDAAHLFEGADSTFPLVIVAGQEKAAGVAAAGAAVLSPCGGEHKLSDHWLSWAAQESQNRSAVIVANDNDPAGMAANAEICQQLVGAGVEPAKIRVVQWSEETDPIGCDLSDVMKRSGCDGLQAFLNQSATYEPPPQLPPELQKTADAIADMKAQQAKQEADIPEFDPMLDDEPKDRNFISALDVVSLEITPEERAGALGNGLLPHGQILSLVGPPGCGKSRLALQLAIDAVRGEPWAGVIPTHLRGARVLFFQSENSLPRLQTDLDAMTRGCPDRDTVLGNITLQNADAWDYSYSLRDSLYLYRSAVEAINPALIIYDPLSYFFAGDNENDSRQMQDTVQLLRKISGPKRSTVILHHARSGSKEIAKAVGFDGAAFARGSKALLGAVRAQLNLAPASEQDRNLLLLALGKANDTRAEYLSEPAGLRLDPATMTYSRDENFNIAKWQSEMNETPSQARSSGRRNKGGVQDVFDVLQENPEGLFRADLSLCLREKLDCAATRSKDLINLAIRENKKRSQGGDIAGAMGRFVVEKKRSETCNRDAEFFKISPD